MTYDIVQPVPRILTGIDTPLADAGIPEIAFLLAGTTAIVGMSLGIYMGVVHDFQLAPVHAHLNVIGWLSMFAIGLYYKVHNAVRGRLVTAQFVTFALGYLLLTGGLAAMFLLGGSLAFLGTVAGSLLLLTSMALFVLIVLRTTLGVVGEYHA